MPVQFVTPTEIIERLGSTGIGGISAMQTLLRENALLARGTVEGIIELKQVMRLVDVPAKPVQITVGIRGPGVGGSPIAVRSTARGLAGDNVIVDDRATVSGHAAQLRVSMKTQIQGSGELRVTSDWDISVPVAGGSRGPVRLVKRLNTTTLPRPGEENPVADVDLAGCGGEGILRLWIRLSWR